MIHIDNQTQGKNSFPKGVLVIALVLIIIAGAVAYTMSQNNQSVTDTQTPARNEDTSNNTNTAPTTETDTADEYQNGTYEAVGEYISPGGQENIAVTLTLEEGVITEVEVEPRATRPISVQMQSDFAANYKPMVQGRNIDEVQLTKVSGSSLTPGGFNDALEKIKVQARS